MISVRHAAAAAFVLLAGCASRPPVAAHQVLGFRALMRQAGVGRADTLCLSVAVGSRERDPAPQVLDALRDSVPAIQPLSGCRGSGPEPPLIRLATVRVRGDTLEVIGETVAEHLSRYRCHSDRRSGDAVGECTLIHHQ